MSGLVACLDIVCTHSVPRRQLPFLEALKKIEVLKELLPDPSGVAVVVNRTMKLLESAGGNLPRYVSQLGFELSFGNKSSKP